VRSHRLKLVASDDEPGLGVGYLCPDFVGNAAAALEDMMTGNPKLFLSARGCARSTSNETQRQEAEEQRATRTH